MKWVRPLDVVVAAASGSAAQAALSGSPRDAVLVAVAAAVGLCWRRPAVCAGLAAVASGPLAVWADADRDSPWNLVLLLVASTSLGAWTTSVAAVVMGVVGLAVVVVLAEGMTVVDFVWICVLLATTACVGGLARAAVDRGRRLQDAAEALSTEPAEVVARRAVIEERSRLGVDVEAVVRSAVLAMAARAEAAASNDREAVRHLQAVREQGQQAVGELRRLLGLLREASVEPCQDTPDAASVRAAAARSRAPVPSVDVVLAVGLVSLALAERQVFRSDFPPGADTVVSAVLTACAAFSVVVWRSAPGWGAAACGGAFVLGWLSGSPVTAGLWFVVAAGGLAWASTAEARRAWPGLLVLTVGVVIGQATSAPYNLLFSLVVVVVGSLGGALTASGNRRAGDALNRSQELTFERAQAAEQAVRAERLAVARELHDVVSHAIGLMVVQAGAAEALWTADPAGARRALSVLQAAAHDSLRELDRLVAVIGAGALGAAVASAPTPRSVADLRRLVGRMCAAGLDVTMTAVASDDDLDPAVYRVVQESLTNVLRYAPGAHVEVLVEVAADQVIVQVVDDGPGPQAGLRRGYGLIGLTERLERAGGVLTAGPDSSGHGFAVRAELPHRPGVPA